MSDPTIRTGHLKPKAEIRLRNGFRNNTNITADRNKLPRRVNQRDDCRSGLMKLKKISPTPRNDAGSTAASPVTGLAVRRRDFLRNSGLMAGGAALATGLTPGMIRKAKATDAAAPASAETKTVRTICTHCSVGCGVYAGVRNGVWTEQDAAFDHPFNRGAHCAKGAALREHGHGERRLKYPMKLVDGKWKRVDWDTAVNEIGDQMVAIREQSGPDSVYWLGSAKHNNEQAYLFRKFAALWGTNNVDHQARIWHEPL